MQSRGQITFIIILAVLATLLVAQFAIPQARIPPGEWVQVLYLLGFLALIGGGVIANKRITLSQALTYGGIWMIIILALMIGYQLWQGQAP